MDPWNNRAIKFCSFLSGSERIKNDRFTRRKRTESLNEPTKQPYWILLSFKIIYKWLFLSIWMCIYHLWTWSMFSFSLFKLFKSFFIFLHVGVNIHIDITGKPAGVSSPSYMWVLGIKLKLLGLLSSVFNHWSNLLPITTFLIVFLVDFFTQYILVKVLPLSTL